MPSCPPPARFPESRSSVSEGVRLATTGRKRGTYKSGTYAPRQTVSQGPLPGEPRQSASLTSSSFPAAWVLSGDSEWRETLEISSSAEDLNGMSKVTQRPHFIPTQSSPAPSKGWIEFMQCRSLSLHLQERFCRLLLSAALLTPHASPAAALSPAACFGAQPLVSRCYPLMQPESQERRLGI